VIPGAGANKDPINKPIRAIVAVWGTTVRVIPVVAVGANRAGTVIAGADSNADNYSLRVGRNCQRKYANGQQANIL
jgi:hypothetical protein